MTPADTLSDLDADARRELTEHILPFWAGQTLDPVHGGFVGRIDGHGARVPGAPKGVVLNARILWTFAAAARALGDEAYGALAERAFGYLHACGRDRVHGGVYWSLTEGGRPLDTKKQVYAQAFAIYGAAEYVRLTGSQEALGWAQELFDLLETRAADAEHGGYFEAFSRDWGPAADVRLSEKDADAPKSMNTHLHVLEAYTALYRVWPAPALAARVRDLVGLFLDRVVDPATGHLVCFFEADWSPLPGAHSYGHDIEAAWLVDEAAGLLGDDALSRRTAAAAVRLARGVLDEGVDADGGLFNEGSAHGVEDTDKHWWPQAEAVVGFLNAYRHTGDARFAEAAAAAWAFVQARIVDRTSGEWFFRVARDGQPYLGEDKVGPWKCPYHSARACLEVAERVPGLSARPATAPAD